MGNSRQKVDIYGGRDPADLPAYSLPECAHFLRVPSATLRTWVMGRHYHVGARKKFWEPVVEIADPTTPAVSFRNAIELHVLAAMRRQHNIRLSAVRRAIQFVSEQLGVGRPLADQQMLTDGKDLFVDKLGKIVNISRGGQLEMRATMEIYLQRIERDPTGLPIRLFPFTRTNIDASPRVIAIDPRVQFGRPCIAGAGIPTSIIAERYRAGDDIEALAKDYGQESSCIQEAIRFEFGATAA
jgi:uncharacterized protein (DUF433 family)